MPDAIPLPPLHVQIVEYMTGSTLATREPSVKPCSTRGKPKNKRNHENRGTGACRGSTIEDGPLVGCIYNGVTHRTHRMVVGAGEDGITTNALRAGLNITRSNLHKSLRVLLKRELIVGRAVGGGTRIFPTDVGTA